MHGFVIADAMSGAHVVSHAHTPGFGLATEGVADPASVTGTVAGMLMGLTATAAEATGVDAALYAVANAENGLDLQSPASITAHMEMLGAPLGRADRDETTSCAPLSRVHGQHGVALCLFQHRVLPFVGCVVAEAEADTAVAALIAERLVKAFVHNHGLAYLEGARAGRLKPFRKAFLPAVHRVLLAAAHTALRVIIGASASCAGPDGPPLVLAVTDAALVGPKADDRRAGARPPLAVELQCAAEAPWIVCHATPTGPSPSPAGLPFATHVRLYYGIGLAEDADGTPATVRLMEAPAGTAPFPVTPVAAPVGVVHLKRWEAFLARLSLHAMLPGAAANATGPVQAELEALRVAADAALDGRLPDGPAPSMSPAAVAAFVEHGAATTYAAELSRGGDGCGISGVRCGTLWFVGNLKVTGLRDAVTPGTAQLSPEAATLRSLLRYLPCLAKAVKEEGGPPEDGHRWCHSADVL